MRRIPPAAVLIVTLSAGFAAPEATAQPPAPSPIHVLNVAPPCSQRNPDLAALGGGGFVATWTGTIENGFGAGARVLDAHGAPVGDELEISSGGQFGNDDARVAPIADGGFAVAWIDFDPAGDPAFRILLRAFDADGTPRGSEVPAAALAGQPIGFALAGDGLGRPAVAWSEGGAVRFRLFETDLTARSPVRTAALLDPGLDGRPGRVAIAADADGELLVVWEEGPNPQLDPAPPWAFDRVRGRRFDPDGTARGGAFTIDAVEPGSAFSQTPAAAAIAGGWAVAWAHNPWPFVQVGEVRARVLEPTGAPAGSAFRVNASDLDFAQDPDVAALPDGGFALAWSGIRPPPPVDPQPPFWDSPVVFGRRFDAAGAPRGGEAEADFPSDRYQSDPAVAASDDGRLVAVWKRHYPFPPILPPPCSEAATIESRTFDPGCVADGTRLCLQGGRIAVEVLVDDPRIGVPLMASAEPLTEDTGTFWVFRPENVELAVKVLDGAEVDGWFWFFSGALSDLGYEIVVTDTLTGVSRRYENLPGEVRSRADTRALLNPPVLPGSLIGSRRSAATAPDTLPGPSGGAAGPMTAAAEDEAGGGTPPRSLAGAGGAFPPPCADGALCLHGERFEVSIAWDDPRSGASGVATGVPLTDRSAYFWFFRPGNAEVVLKILDGTEINGFFWVFFGALTDLEYTITIADRTNSCIWRYDNPPFALTSRADTTALTGLPLPCGPPPPGSP